MDERNLRQDLVAVTYLSAGGPTGVRLCDQCGHCEVRGTNGLCLETPCGYHHTWASRNRGQRIAEQDSEIARLKAEVEVLERALELACSDKYTRSAAGSPDNYKAEARKEVEDE